MVSSKTFIALTLCLTFLAHGQNKKTQESQPNNLYKFKCVTEYPTTSFFFDDDGDHFKIRIRHHNGTQYAPFVQRLIVPNDMADVLEAAEVAKNTGDNIELRWNKKNCERLNDQIFSCVGGGESLTSAKKQIKPWLISKNLVTTQTVHGEFKKYVVTMGYDIQGKSYEYVMDYQMNECEFE